MARARPTKFTQARVDAICESIKLGATYELAARAAGIHPDTLTEWRKNKPDFSESLKEAEAQGVLVSLAHIQAAAAQGIWQASAWILERRFPDDYGKRERMDVKHSGSVDMRLLADLRKVIVAALGDSDPLARLRIADALAGLEEGSIRHDN